MRQAALIRHFTLHRFLLAPLFLLMFAITACKPEGQSAGAPPESASPSEDAAATNNTAPGDAETPERKYAWPEQKEDVAHILSKGTTLTPSPLDLSDDRDYRYLVNQLKIAGITPEFAPQFHKVIEAERVRHQDPEYVKAAHAKTLAMMTPDVAAGNYVVDAINLMTSVGATAQGSSNVVTSGLSSVKGGTMGTHLTLSLYDANNHLIVQGNKSSPSGQGQYTFADTAGASATEAVHSSMLYSYVDNGGGFHSATLYAATDDLPITITNDAPTYTRHGVTTGDIVACMYRNSNNKSDCDYWQPNGHKVILPVKGSMDYHNPIVKQGGVPVNGKTFFFLLHPDPNAGGGCTFPGLDAAQFFQSATYPNASTVAWNFNPQDFGQTKQCMPSGQTALFTLSVEVQVNDNGVQKPAVGAITSSGASAVNDNVKHIPEIKIFWGCLIEGSMVELADGTFKPVEEVVAQQDRVVTDIHGDTRLVTATVHGEEDFVIKVTTEKGQTISLTKNHPVIMSGYQIKLAREISVGDAVITRAGLEKVTEVKQEEYNGKVYNLVLEQTNDVERERGGMLFADGFLVGDNHMQKVFEKAYKKRASTIHENAPIEWRTDNENILKRHAERGEDSVF